MYVLSDVPPFHTHTNTLEDRQAISRKTIHGIRTKPRRLEINSPKIDLIGPEQSRAKYLKRCAAFLRLFDTRVIVYLFIFFFFWQTFNLCKLYNKLARDQAGFSFEN